MNYHKFMIYGNHQCSMIPFAKPVTREPICTFVSDIYQYNKSINYKTITVSTSNIDSSIGSIGSIDSVGSIGSSVGSSNEIYSFTLNEISMPLINFNNYIKINNFNEEKIKALKIERRRYKNRGYSKNSRLKKKMSNSKSVN